MMRLHACASQRSSVLPSMMRYSAAAEATRATPTITQSRNFHSWTTSREHSAQPSNKSSPQAICLEHLHELRLVLLCRHCCRCDAMRPLAGEGELVFHDAAGLHWHDWRIIDLIVVSRRGAVAAAAEIEESYKACRRPRRLILPEVAAIEAERIRAR